jgi:hypothetical protein
MHRYHQHHHRYTVFCCISELLMVFSFHVLALVYTSAAVALGLTVFCVYMAVSSLFLHRSVVLARAEVSDSSYFDKRD